MQCRQIRLREKCLRVAFSFARTCTLSRAPSSLARELLAAAGRLEPASAAAEKSFARATRARMPCVAPAGKTPATLRGQGTTTRTLRPQPRRRPLPALKTARTPYTSSCAGPGKGMGFRKRKKVSRSADPGLPSLYVTLRALRLALLGLALRALRGRAAGAQLVPLGVLAAGRRHEAALACRTPGGATPVPRFFSRTVRFTFTALLCQIRTRWGRKNLRHQAVPLSSILSHSFCA